MEIWVSSIIFGSEVATYNFIFAPKITVLKAPCSTSVSGGNAGFFYSRTIWINSIIRHQWRVGKISFSLKPLFTLG